MIFLSGYPIKRKEKCMKKEQIEKIMNAQTKFKSDVKEIDMISKEAIEIVDNWLEYSGLTMDEFKERINRENFVLSFYKNSREARCALYNEVEMIGQPFVSGSDVESFVYDLAIILYRIAAISDCQRTFDYVTSFIKTDIITH